MLRINTQLYQDCLFMNIQFRAERNSLGGRKNCNARDTEERKKMVSDEICGQKQKTTLKWKLWQKAVYKQKTRAQKKTRVRVSLMMLVLATNEKWHENKKNTQQIAWDWATERKSKTYTYLLRNRKSDEAIWQLRWCRTIHPFSGSRNDKLFAAVCQWILIFHLVSF